MIHEENRGWLVDDSRDLQKMQSLVGVQEVLDVHDERRRGEDMNLIGRIYACVSRQRDLAIMAPR